MLSFWEKSLLRYILEIGRNLFCLRDLSEILPAFFQRAILVVEHAGAQFALHLEGEELP